MKRRRHVMTAILAGVPLLALGLVCASRGGGGNLWLIFFLWALAVAVLEGVNWRAIAAPVREMMRDLEVDNAHEAQRALRGLRTTAMTRL